MFRPEFILSVCSLAGHEKWALSAENMFDIASKDGQVGRTPPTLAVYFIFIFFIFWKIQNAGVISEKALEPHRYIKDAVA